ncbi:MAG: hypothetical protein H6Q89_4303 [Myxococcaceae bacterium]|nr:hypothetical protein [Myxococcaceae bacterium]
MAFYDPVLQRLKQLSPSSLRGIADEKITVVVLKETTRAKVKIDELSQRYPTAGPRELAQRMIDSKKAFAGMVGGVSGVFGIATLPADLGLMVYLQLALLVEVATLYKVNLKSERARQELLDVFGYANGIGPLQRASPKLVGKLATLLLQKGGLETFGRAMPLVAAPISAYLNNQHIQQVGEQAIRHYDGFTAAHAKAKKASGA